MVDLAEDYLIDPREGMRKLTASYLNEVMQLEAQKQIQARHYERTGKRKGHRNGSRPRSLKTIHGDITLDKPEIREFPLKTKVFERYSRVEESVRVAVAESYFEEAYQPERSRRYSQNLDYMASLPLKSHE
jgi:transposase-like protein